MATRRGITISLTSQGTGDFLLYTIPSILARSNLAYRTIQATFQVVRGNNLANKGKAEGKSKGYSNTVLLLILVRTNTWYAGEPTEVITISGSISKTLALKSCKTFGQGETIPTPSSNEESQRKTGIVNFQKPAKQLFKLNEKGFSPLVLMIKTAPPLLYILQNISLLFSQSIDLHRLN